MESSCLTRELGRPAFAVHFGARRTKPRALHLLQLRGQDAPEEQKVLYLLLGKEDGHTYYCSGRLHESPTALRTLQACATVEEAYARLPLLASPSATVAVPVYAVEVADLTHGGVEVTDGQAEIAVDLAVRLGLLADEDRRQGRLVSWQFRAMLPTLRRGGESAVCKGMLLPNKKLPDGQLLVRSSCIKVRWPSRRLAARIARLKEATASL